MPGNFHGSSGGFSYRSRVRTTALCAALGLGLITLFSVSKTRNTGPSTVAARSDQTLLQPEQRPPSNPPPAIAQPYPDDHPIAHATATVASPRAALSNYAFATEWESELPPELAAFREWTRRIVDSADATAFANWEREGVHLAQARRAAMRDLIRDDPRRALAVTVPAAVRQRLPASVLDRLEERVSGTGSLVTIASTPRPGAPFEPSWRAAWFRGRQFRAYTFGRHDGVAALERVSIVGIALDGALAVSDQPLRALEAGESIEGREITEVCAVSGKTPRSGQATRLALTQVAGVEFDDAIQLVCSPQCAIEIAGSLMALESSPSNRTRTAFSSSVEPSPPNAWTTGTHKILVIRIEFTELAGPLISQQQGLEVMDGQVKPFFEEGSYGQVTMLSTVTAKSYVMPKTIAEYSTAGTGLGLLHTDAVTAAAADYDVDSFDRHVVVYKRTSPSIGDAAGYGVLLGKQSWIIGNFGLKIVAHELGHNYGLSHANRWQPPAGGGATSPLGISLEYGDFFDGMGYGGPKRHFNQDSKNRLGWLPDANVTDVRSSGTYRVYEFDSGELDVSRPQSLRLYADGVRWFSVGYRGAIESPATAATGAYLIMGGRSPASHTDLIDINTPGPDTDTSDAVLQVGASFTEPNSGVTIRNVAAGGASPSRYLDVEVALPAAATGPSPAAWGSVPEHAPLFPRIMDARQVIVEPSYLAVLREDGSLLETHNQSNINPATAPEFPAVGPGGRIMVAAAGIRVLVRTDGTVAIAGSAVPANLASIPAEAVNVREIAFSGQHVLALREDGRVIAWGQNLDGQCSVPNAVIKAVSVATTITGSAAVLADGSVVHWGRSYAPAPAEAVDLVKIQGAIQTLLGLKRDGSVVVWGTDSFSAMSSIPSELNLLREVRDIATGGEHHLALKRDGSIVAWGSNRHGITRIPPIGPAVGIGAGINHATAIVGNGTVRFTVPPRKTSAVIPSPAIFTAFAVGSPALTLQWQRQAAGDTTWSNLTNDATYTGTQTEWLTVRNTALAMNGDRFRCVTSSTGATVVTSEEATLEVRVPPPTVVLQTKSQQILTAGGSTSLTAVASGHGALKYQWRRNGVPIAGASSNTLQIAGAQASDEALYDVVVTDTGVSATSDATQITVQPATYPDGLRARPDFAPQVFSNNGLVTAIASAANGTFVVAGDFEAIGSDVRAGVARFTATGALDTAFVPPVIDGPIDAVAVQPDGRIIIGGGFTSVGGVRRGSIARLLTDGSLDTSFAASWGFDSRVHALALQPDGGIVVGGRFTGFDGQSRPNIARLTASGGLDGTFSPGAGPNDAVFSLALQSDGRILAGGDFTTYQGQNRMRIVRLLRSGAVDTAFESSSAFNLRVDALAVQANGGVLVGGQFSQHGTTAQPYLARLSSGGALDANFTSGGSPNRWVKAIVIRPDGRILLGGSFTQIGTTSRGGLAQLTSAGTIDTAFAPSNVSWIFALAIQADGTAVAGGLSTVLNGNTALARFSATGATLPYAITRFLRRGRINALARTSGGRWMIGGDFSQVGSLPRNCLARLLSDGSVDPSFDPGAGANGPVYSLAPQADGNVVIAGDFTSYAGAARKMLARVQADGGNDVSFDPGVGAKGSVRTVTVAPAGGILVGGNFSSFAGSARGGICRLLSTGVLDTKFNPGAGFDGTVEVLALQVDGRILAGGSFASFAGVTRNRIARLNADGTLDMSFDPGAGANLTVYCLAPTATGALLGGDFTNLGGLNRGKVGMLTATGAVDATFAPIIGCNSRVTAAALERSGRIVIAGLFTAADGIARPYLSRLTTAGALDSALNVVGMEVTSSGGFNRMVQTPEGWIVCAGSFTNAPGHPGGEMILFEQADSPIVTAHPVSQHVLLGDPLTLAATATNTTTWQWRKNGVAIVGATSATLSLNSTTSSDAGEYTVLVSNASGFSESAVAVVTASPLRISAAPTAVTAGSSVTLSSATAGITPTAYQWYRDDVAIDGATSATYTVPSAQRFHNGTYHVTVTSTSAIFTSNSVALSVTAAPVSEARLLNLSTRALDLTGDNVLIPGFVLTGTGTKRMLIRSIGPTLGAFGVNGTLADPAMTLKSGGATLASNDDWGTNANKAEIISTSARLGAFALADGSKDAALLLDLAPGAYTVPTAGNANGTGVAMVELYDADTGTSTTKLINLSNRGFVDIGDNIMIPGFVISPEGSRTFLIRAVGPGLNSTFKLTGVLEDPVLTVFKGGNAILSNDDWGANPSAAITQSTSAAVGAFALVAGSKDAALVVSLSPGAYTVQATGKNGNTGVALVELYLVP